jgi:hypothetical protein
LTSGVIDGIGRYRLGDDAPWMDGFRVAALIRSAAQLSRPGDSGAAWYRTEDGRGIGLHVGGTLGGEGSMPAAIACVLQAVLARLGVSVLTQKM